LQPDVLVGHSTPSAQGASKTDPLDTHCFPHGH
jgi:hypothetical protein